MFDLTRCRVRLVRAKTLGVPSCGPAVRHSPCKDRRNYWPAARINDTVLSAERRSPRRSAPTLLHSHVAGMLVSGVLPWARRYPFLSGKPTALLSPMPRAGSAFDVDRVPNAAPPAISDAILTLLEKRGDVQVADVVKDFYRSGRVWGRPLDMRRDPMRLVSPGSRWSRQ